MNEFEDQLMRDYGVKGRAEVHKGQPYICVRVLQVGHGCVKCDGDGVLCESICFIGILVTE